MAKRSALSKKIRFEVFKRDAFSCQYCGRTAPDVILHVDHINPIAKGGANEILNLVTACIDCNLGKGARELGDNAVVKKQIDQMKAISLRQEQLAMMAEWRTGMLSLEQSAAEALFKHINHILAETDWEPNESYRNTIRTMLKKYSVEEVYASIDAGAASYLRNPTSENVDKFLNLLPRICYWRRAEKENPVIGEINRLVGLASSRWYRCNRHTLYRDLLSYHQDANIPIETLRANINASTGIMQFEEAMGGVMNG